VFGYVGAAAGGCTRPRARAPAAAPEPELPDAGKGLTELRGLFDSLDKDHDGKVTGQEWGKKVKENQALLAKYFGGSTLQEIGSAFSRIDADGNKSLSWEEFVEAAGLGLAVLVQSQIEDSGKPAEDSLALALPEESAPSAGPAVPTSPVGENQKKLKGLFDELDANHDGTVSRAEFIKALRRRESGVSEFFGLTTTVRQEDGTRDAFERVFQAMDQDSSRNISWDEFVSVAERFHAEASAVDADADMDNDAAAAAVVMAALDGAKPIEDGALSLEDEPPVKSKTPPQIPPLNIAKAQIYQGAD
jgi:Ca2+-binding EF-hand superfamily protein